MLKNVYYSHNNFTMIIYPKTYKRVYNKYTPLFRKEVNGYEKTTHNAAISQNATKPAT